MVKKNQYIGSSFDEFLEEEGLLQEVELVAAKRVLAFQLEKLMEESHLSKTATAKRMHTSRSALDRLIDPENLSVTLQTIGKAAAVFGKKVQLTLV